MTKYKFAKELYPKIALMKAAYFFTNTCYIHLDADDSYYYVEIDPKNMESPVTEKTFVNEMLAQSVRHMVYQQTKNIRELMLARAMATTVVGETESSESLDIADQEYQESELLKNWFEGND